MWFDFGIGEKKKPVVRIFDSSVVFSDDVDVLDLREVAFQARPGGVFKVAAPPQDTIESLINRLIELGEPKPEVVITGEKIANGSEKWTATIDSMLVYVREYFCGREYNETVFGSIDSVESAVIKALKNRLSRVVTETTTITY